MTVRSGVMFGILGGAILAGTALGGSKLPTAQAGKQTTQTFLYTQSHSGPNYGINLEANLQEWIRRGWRVVTAIENESYSGGSTTPDRVITVVFER